MRKNDIVIAPAHERGPVDFFCLTVVVKKRVVLNGTFFERFAENFAILDRS